MEGKFGNKLKPYFLVIFMQFGYAGTAILAKSALNQGMNHYTFSVYRNIIATVFFAPFAFVLERKIRPRMTISVLLKITLLGLLEPVIDQNLYYSGMKYTTATFTSAMCNILPAITFLLAWILRLEKVNLKRLNSQGKVVGTLVTVSGAMIMTLLRGPVLGLPWTTHTSHHSQLTNSSNPQQPIKGALMITIGCFCWSIFYILQANTLRTYPAGLSLTTMVCMAGAVEGTILTLVVERGNATIWSVAWDAKLLAYVYAGLVSSGIGYFVSGVVSKAKGPVFLTSFNPLSMAVIAVMSSFIFAEQLDVGKVAGATVILIGLYLVIWSRKNEQDETACTGSDPIVHQDIPITNPSAGSPKDNEKTDVFHNETSSRNNIV